MLNNNISKDELRRRMGGCWLGKAVGGTLGMPFEGGDGPLDLTFYEPVPETMLPNDDLDLQVLWACVLDKQKEVRVDRDLFAEAWLTQVEFPWDEYGVAIRNLKMGLKSPQSGSYDNWFVHGMGAAIRTEIWACLAPGDPVRAAAYAYEDACVDHDGEGIWAAMFFAALQSLAFVESDTDELIDQALDVLPESSTVREAVVQTRVWWRQNSDWRRVRDKILKAYGHENFTDVTMNIAFTILGWLDGQGDFSRAICTATNCGKDTDCTAATVGALMGIIDPDCIDERWLKPIGKSLVISKEITGIDDHPPSLELFTELVLDLYKRLDRHAPVGLDSRAVVEKDVPPIEVDLAFSKGHKQNMGGSNCPEFLLSRTHGLPGTIGRLSEAEFEGDVAHIRYRFKLEKARRVRIMCNTHQACAAWVDKQLLFESSGGAMSPSFHRAPKDQWADVELAGGDHELVIALARPALGGDVEWVVGIADASTHQWLECFLRSGQAIEC